MRTAIVTPSTTGTALTGFDNPWWNTASDARLLNSAATDTVFQTVEWQRAWWKSFGRGKLLPVLAVANETPVCFAPLYADCGMVYFVGSGGSDYLDFCGDVTLDERLDKMLLAAREQVDGFAGFVFYHVPDRSPTPAALAATARRLGWLLYDEGDLPAPAMDLAGNREQALCATRKTSLVRHENALRRSGTLRVHHTRDGREIRPHLEDFFRQHVARWARTPYPSLFLDPVQRRFYQGVCGTAADTGWLRFTRVEWNGRPVAYHFGFSYRGSYLWYKPTFEIELARYSPGEVLLRHLLLAALDEGASTFDFGLGDEPFKRRFATHVNTVRSWGLYPPEAVNPGGQR